MSAQLVYNYDGGTKIFSGTALAKQSPLEEDVNFLPANATFVEVNNPLAENDRVFNVTTQLWGYQPVTTAPVIDEALLARNKRNGLLFLYDWTQLPDTALDPAEASAWAVYRQLLRDVPQQVSFPETIVWPVKPGSGA